MRQYVARRLLQLIPVLLGVSILVFAVVRIIPGDPALIILVGPGGGGIASEEELLALRQKLGTDQPVHVQYVTWIGRILRLDLGNSFWSGRPITQELAARLPLTFELTILAMVAALSIAIPVGILSALHQDTWVDYLFRVVTVSGLAIPSFWLGTLIILFLVIWFQWLPPSGYIPFFDNPWANLQQLIFPALAMGYRMSAITSRMTRSCMLEVLRQDYVRTAWAKGLRQRVVLLRHALKNALLPVVTIAGFQFALLLGGTVIMETVFNLPGMGRGLVDSLVFKDYPMVQVTVLLIALFFVTINLAVDMAYAWLDPRIRYA